VSPQESPQPSIGSEADVAGIGIPMPDHSRTGLGLLIPLPDWFRRQHFFFICLFVFVCPELSGLQLFSHLSLNLAF
jgi:hypothetical protein